VHHHHHHHHLLNEFVIVGPRRKIFSLTPVHLVCGFVRWMWWRGRRRRRRRGGEVEGFHPAHCFDHFPPPAWME